MASIPLPALDVRTPQQPDLLEKFSQLQQLRGNQQAMQIRAQQAPLQQQQLEQGVQGGQVDLQMKQQQLKDQQAMTASMNQWDGKDLNDLAPLILKNGGSATAVMGLKQHALEQKAKISAIAKDDAETGKNQIDTAMKKNDAVSGALGSILQVPDEQLPQALVSTAQQLSQQGLLDPQHVQLAQQLAQSGNPQQIRQQLDVMRKGITSNSQLMEQAKADQQAANQDAMRKQAAQNAQQTQLNENRAAGQRQQGLNIEGARLKFEQRKAGMDPTGQPSDVAQAIARGQLAPERMAYLIARNPEVLQGVLQADPSFDSSKAAAYPKVYQDFTSGKTSVALNAGATALGHLSELKDLNTAASHIPGTPAYNAYQNKVDTVASELAKFYGDATIPAIAAIKKTLAANLPGGRDAAIKTQAQSMGDKLDSFQQTWQNAAPSKAYQAPMPGISPKAQAARQSLAGTAGASISVTAPNGKVYSFKDQQSADTFKKNAGIQ